MMKRLLIAGMVLALIGAACGDDGADTTASTTVAAGVTTTTASCVDRDGDGTAAGHRGTGPGHDDDHSIPDLPYAVEGDFSAPKWPHSSSSSTAPGYGPLSDRRDVR